MKKNIILIVVDLLIILLTYYFLLPPINISSPIFWGYLVFILMIVLLSLLIKDSETVFSRRGFNLKMQPGYTKKYLWLFIVLGVVIASKFVVNFIFSPLFNAKEYSERIKVNESTSFTADVKEVDFSKIPLLDKVSSEKLGDRKMGEASSWVSQFYVSDLYTQINYNNEIVRVTPIEYADIIKYFTNRKEGIKGYIKVNSVTGEANLVNIEKGIRYTESAYFFENVERYLRIKYPFTIFDDLSFEIDNEGNPYWIAPTVKYKGIGLKKE